MDAQDRRNDTIPPDAGGVRMRRRKRLVPRSALVAAAVSLCIVAAAASAWVLVARGQLVEVPSLRGLPEAAARETLDDAGLEFVLEASRVSAEVPLGSVISQEPAAGGRIRSGEAVRVVLSVGPQTFTLPDLVGSPIQGATDALEALGFAVEIEEVTAESTAAVVLAMYPAPGSSLNAGDTVRLTTPGPDSGTALVPYAISGVTVLVDPAPPVTGASDPAMDVARRLTALLQAAGAEVSLTRLGLAGSEGDRTTILASSTARVLIGIDVTSNGTAGVRVTYNSSGVMAAQSRVFAGTVARALVAVGEGPPLTAASADPLVTSFAGVAARVALGDAAVAADAARFADPSWTDDMARALYRAVGTTFAAE